MTGHRRRIVWIVAFTTALLVPGAGSAGAHEHPTPTERSAPAVVWVEARAEVEVALVEHREADPAGIHIAIIQSSSNPLLASASGFVVDPTGTVVTSGVIHPMTSADRDRAMVYAVNEAFRKQYGDRARLAGDPFTRQRVGADSDLLQQRLAACYPPNHTNDAGGCVVRVTPTYVVYPYVTDQAKFGQLPAELAPSSTGDVAVLRVRGANGMPTVALAESRAGAQALSVLGFFGVPGPRQGLHQVYAHLAAVGGSTLKTSSLTATEAKANTELAAGLKAGMRGGPVVAEQGQVIGFLSPDAGSGPPPAAPGRLVDVGAVRKVLSAENITPRRGPVDASYEAAMHPFKNGGYAAAIPHFKSTLGLFPGHALAAQNLATAQQHVASGTPGPTAAAQDAMTGMGSGTGGGFPWTTVLIAVGAVVLLLAAGAAAVLVRRRRAPTPSGGAPKPGTATPRAGRPGAPQPRNGRPAVQPRAPTGGLERHQVPSEAHTGPAPSAHLVRHGPSHAADAGSHGGSRGLAAPAAASSGRGAAIQPAGEDRPAFCTSCGRHVAAHHRFCGWCGAATA